MSIRTRCAFPLGLLFMACMDAGTTAAPWKSPLALATNPGERTYLKWCAPCHAAGLEHPGTNALTARYAGAAPGALTERRDLDPAMVKLMVRQGISVMPQFRKTEISVSELEALASWLAAQGRMTKKERRHGRDSSN